MKIIVSHPNSNQFNRWALDGLMNKDMLHEFNTSVASFPGSFLDKLSNVKSFSEIKRRSFVSRLQPFTKCSPWLETGRIVSNKFGLQSLTKHETGVFSVDSVYKDIDVKTKARLKHAKHNGAKGVYAYEDGALNTFLEISSRSFVCVSKSCASACKFQIHVVVVGPFANVLEKWPGFAHFSKLVATGSRSTIIFTFFASRSGGLIVMAKNSPCINYVNSVTMKIN